MKANRNTFDYSFLNEKVKTDKGQLAVHDILSKMSVEDRGYTLLEMVFAFNYHELEYYKNFFNCYKDEIKDALKKFHPKIADSLEKELKKCSQPPIRKTSFIGLIGLFFKTLFLGK